MINQSFFLIKWEKIKKETHRLKKWKNKGEKKNSNHKKFLVQLGVFKSRANAENKKRKLEKKMKKIFKISFNIKTF